MQKLVDTEGFRLVANIKEYASVLASTGNGLASRYRPYLRSEPIVL